MAQPHPVSHEVRPGDVLVGKYRVERVLGAGGMGVVVAAHHVQLDIPVAIKMLLPALLEDPEVVMRFEREARAAARVTNEHVARVFDVGTLSSGLPYMVMELLEGRDLGALLVERGPLPVEEAVDFLLQTCAAIQEAHALGIIHRDLKPSNLFCVRRPDGQPFIKVLDFGISKLSDATQSGMSVTRTSTLLGTPLYMSPEQMRSTKDVNAQTDIWSLGVVLYELLTGAPPFVGDTLPEVCVRIATETPPPLRSARADVSPRLEAVVSRCLERDRSRRFASAGELAAALVEFAPVSRLMLGPIVGAGPALRGASTVKTITAVVPRATPVPFGRRSDVGRSSERRVVAAIAVALVAVAVTVLLLIGISRTRTPAASGGTAIASSGPTASGSANTAPSALPTTAGFAPFSSVASGEAAPDGPDVAPSPKEPSSQATADALRSVPARPAPKARARAAAANAARAVAPATGAPVSAPTTVEPPATPSARAPPAKHDDAYEHM